MKTAQESKQSLKRKQAEALANDDTLLQQAIEKSLQEETKGQQPPLKKQKISKEIKTVIAEMIPNEKIELAREFIFGAGRYKEIFSEIRSFLPGKPGPECNTITLQGRNCSRSYFYVDVNDKKNKKDCKTYCDEQCNKWISRLILEFPVKVAIDIISRINATIQSRKVLNIEVGVLSFEVKSLDDVLLQQVTMVRRQTAQNQHWYMVTEKSKLSEEFEHGQHYFARTLEVHTWYTLEELLNVEEEEFLPDEKDFVDIFSPPINEDELIKTVLQKVCFNEKTHKIYVSVRLWARQDKKNIITETTRKKNLIRVHGFSSRNHPNLFDIYFQPVQVWGVNVSSDYIPPVQVWGQIFRSKHFLQLDHLDDEYAY